MLYSTVGISKQAVNQYSRRQQQFDAQVDALLIEVEELRAEQPGCGVEKMYYTLQPTFLGRDRFIALFMELGYRVRRTKNYKKTTTPSRFYYPNLIDGMLVNRPGMIWQSDITYIPIGGQHYYAVFIIDVFSKMIVGYQVSDHMRASANVAALQMALKKHSAPDIHHSDRGSQYIYLGYIHLLMDLKCRISMGETCQQNAYAERINRTIKEEYLDYWKPQTFEQLKRSVAKAVDHYNTKRIHYAINRHTPQHVDQLYRNGYSDPSLNFTIFKYEKSVNTI
jgi:transposase InsO family protein